MAQRSNSSPSPYLPMAMGTCLLAWALRCYRIGYQSLWYDEANSVHWASEPLPRMVADTAQDIHPPLYYTALHLWIAGGGDSETSVRLCSAVCGTLAVVALCILAKRLAGWQASLATAILSACSPFLVYYGQETRMYALLLLLSTIAGYAMLRALDGAPRWWLVYTPAMAAALWTQLYGALLFGALNLAAVAMLLKRQASRARKTADKSAERTTRRWLVAQIGVVLIFAPWLPVAFAKAATYTSPSRGSPAGWIVADSVVVFGLGPATDGLTALPQSGSSAPDATLLFLTAPFVVAGCMGMGALAGRRLFIAAWLLFPMVAIIALSLGKRDFNARYLMELFPAYVVTSGAGLALLWKRAKTWPLAVVATLGVACGSLLALWLTYTAPAYARDDNRAVVQRVRAQATEGAVVVLDANFTSAFEYYARGVWPVLNVPDRVPPESSSVDAAMRSFTTGHPQVWLVLWHDYYADPDQLVAGWLRRNAFLVETTYVGSGLKVMRFDAVNSAAKHLGVSYGGAIELSSYVVHVDRASRQVSVRLYWRALAHPQGKYATKALLTDTDGTLYAFYSSLLGSERYPTSSWQSGDMIESTLELAAPACAARRITRLQVLLYDDNTNQALAVTGTSTGAMSAILPLDSGTALTSTAPGSDTAACALQAPDGVHRVSARFAGVGVLDGYRIVPHDSGFVVTLYWTAMENVAKNYKVFVHGLDATGREVVNADSDPSGGDAPTGRWAVGEHIWDAHTFTVNPQAHLATIEVGMYDPSTGQRVPVRLEDGSLPPDRAMKLPAAP